MFAPPICRRGWRNNAFPFRQIRRRQRQPSEHRRERSEQSNRARRAHEAPKKLEGAGHPATPSGPPLTNTLQAPGRNPLTANGIGWNPPQQLA
ncbi:MAG: hypothetical protein K0R13_2782 [Propionibacteriaceae bacterium]|nr:hypothetical protein [Propionibacteriaceae bacterium]